MDVGKDLRRSQSLRSISSSGDKLTWTDAGLRDKIPSVSELVAKYQTAVKRSKTSFSRSISGDYTETKTKKVFNEMTSFPLQSTETHLESLMRRNDEREQARAQTNLTRSKSLGSLRSSTGSIEALRALFESKESAQMRVKRNFRCNTNANVSLSYNADTPLVNRDAEDVQRATEELKNPAGNNVRKHVKEEYVTQKVVNQIQTAKRKTIAGIDFEKIAASEADEKKRSIADFRDISFIQTKDVLSVSVKAMSAHYMSKVANKDSACSSPKVEQDQSHEPGKKVKLTKMKEDSLQKTDDLRPLPPDRHEPGLEDSQQSKPSQLSKQMLYQQRQKSELKRLMKHTHPELRMLDDVVDEELAEVLCSEGATVGEIGYEGEVLSRCLIFENRGFNTNMSPYATKIHMAQDTEERCDCSETPGETLKDEPLIKSVDSGPGFNAQPEEEMIRVNVQATRRMFENHSRSNPDEIQENVSMSLEKRNVDQTPNKQSGMSRRENLHDGRKIDLGEPHQEPCFGQRIEQVDFGNEGLSNDETSFECDSLGFPELESQIKKIKTSAALFQNNPFIPTNVEKESSYECKPKTHIAGEDNLTSNVKNRTNLFESTLFDRIRHQNRDEIEMMVENIKETLNSLYNVKAIQSAGAIIEVNETMIAKKAKFTLSDDGPELKYDEVAEGGAQNFLVQLLPRVNLKPQITYLKENSKGSMETMMVNVLVNQHQFDAKKDTEFKTAHVVQLVEDILNQDNSLMKGVIIQKDFNKCAEVIVYSLHKYLDEEDVKSYSPLKTAELETEAVSKTDNEEIRRDRRSPQVPAKDQICSESIRPNVKVNVKLFKSCIEKGDLEYLKSLQDDELEVQEEELSLNQAGQDKESLHEERDLAEESNSEYVPVDVKKLKSMFSEDKSPLKEKSIQSASFSNPSSGKRKSSTESNIGTLSNQSLKECGTQTHLEFVPQDDDRVHRAKLAKDAGEISDLQSSTPNLHQVTMEAEMFHQSFNETEKSHNLDNVKHSKETETIEEHTDSVESGIETSCHKTQLTSDPESDWKNTKTQTCQEDDDLANVQTAESKKSQECPELLQNQLIQTTTVCPHSSEKPPAPEEEQDVLQGKIQAALESLEKSNINVTKGDFRAAMIYRQSSKSQQRPSQNNDTKELYPINKHRSTQDLPKQGETGTPDKTSTGAVSTKSKRPVGPKPPLLPKPEHLKLKREENLPTVPINPQDMQISHMGTKGTVPQVSQSSTSEDKHAFKSSNEMDHQSKEFLEEDKKMLQETEMQHEAEGSGVTLESVETGKNAVSDEQKTKATEKENVPQNVPGKASKTPPLKPKRLRGAYFHKNPKDLPGSNPTDTHGNQNPITITGGQSSNTRGITPEGEDGPKKDTNQESKVEMREKKRRIETEDEQRQRLSVHMDEIVRGNISAAMEIFDNLRKQEQLQSILSRVEEIEQDTSEVDVKSLRRVFENVPDWIVSSDRKKQKKIKAETCDKPSPLPMDRTDNKSSMEHVYGDLERASEEIMNLKEQTLAKLKDIEDAIRKALLSVSTLKSDSDIAGLSCLFKESLGTLQRPSSSANIRKINIGSSSIKSAEESFNTQKNSTTQDMPCARSETSSSSPSSPSFISIQSAARKMETVQSESLICLKCQLNPKHEERFRTTKVLTCNSSQSKEVESRKEGQKQSNSPQNRHQEVSVLEEQTDTKSATEDDERTDNCGNKVYTSKTSTVLTTQPETTTKTSQTSKDSAATQSDC